jgi:hypothetical protein
MKFKVKVESEEKNTATIAIEPLEAGYGNTIGNGLRRTLLSSLQGAAITAVKINGVSHQFSTIPGVIEDVIQIILNLKLVRVKLYGEKSIKMRLTSNGLGEVKAGDIDTLGQAEITNPEQHIATVSDAKAKLTMELTVESGVGYAIADERKSTEIASHVDNTNELNAPKHSLEKIFLRDIIIHDNKLSLQGKIRGKASEHTTNRRGAPVIYRHKGVCRISVSCGKSHHKPAVREQLPFLQKASNPPSFLASVL